MITRDKSLLLRNKNNEEAEFALLDAIPSLVAILSREGIILAVNAAWRRNGEISGASKELVEGVGINYINSFPSMQNITPEISAIRDGVMSVLEGSQTLFQTEYDLDTPEMIKRYRLCVTSMQTPTFKAVVIHDDITSLHQIIIDDKQKQDRLEQLLVIYKNDLENEKNLSRSSGIVRGTLLETISHEIRTPLNSVLGLTDLLNNALSENQKKAYIRKIQTTGKTLRRLVDNVLDFSVLESDIISIESNPFSLESILRATVSTLLGMIESKPIEILINIAPDIPDGLIGDRYRIQQVLINLCSNAAKFTSSGTITINLRRHIINNDQFTYVFTVQDTGSGILEEDLERIFEVYAKTTKNIGSYGGSGLGLSISRRLVHLMGGTMDVRSKIGVGSEFSFALTLLVDSSSTRSQLPTLPTDMRVLVTSDHSDLRSNMHSTCVGYGWQVDAFDFITATSKLCQPLNQAPKHYDLVILDWRTDGEEVLKFLQSLTAVAWNETAHFLFVSSIEDIDRALLNIGKNRLTGLLTRPITPYSLLARVAYVLRGEEEPEVAGPVELPQPLANMRLLVADDNKLNLEIIEIILCNAGAEVVMVSDGAQAVEVLRLTQQPFNAVLMDIQMPVMDGYTATRIIRNELALKDLPIIAVSAFASAENRLKSERAGLSGHLVKPLNVKHLLDVLVQKNSKPIESGISSTEGEASSQSSGTMPATLDLVSAMNSFDGAIPHYLRLLERFIVAHSDDATAAGKLYECGDLKGALAILHTLNGTARMLHAPNLVMLTSAAESALVEDHPEKLPNLLRDINVAMTALAKDVGQLKGRGSET
jgi:signal transduction histidine kinase/CheY-like chemotaxis protein